MKARLDDLVLQKIGETGIKVDPTIDTMLDTIARQIASDRPKNWSAPTGELIKVALANLARKGKLVQFEGRYLLPAQLAEMRDKAAAMPVTVPAPRSRPPVPTAPATHPLKLQIETLERTVRDYRTRIVEREAELTERFKLRLQEFADRAFRDAAQQHEEMATLTWRLGQYRRKSQPRTLWGRIKLCSMVMRGTLVDYLEA